MLQARFVIEQETDDYLYIIDTGVEERSVTHDAAAVLEFLTENYGLGNRRLIYRDSTGQNDEILHENGRFKGFAPGHVGITDL